MPGTSQHLYEAPPIPAFYYRNIIINGNFDIWQRGTSFPNVTGGNYTADRWKCFSVVDTNVIVKRDTAVPNVNSTFSFRIEVATNPGGIGAFTDVHQPIENFNLIAGKPITLTFMAKCDIGVTGSCAFYDGTSVYDTTLITDNTWTYYKMHMVVPSSIPSWTIFFRLNRSGQGVGNGLNICQFQLTQGVARWEYMPPLPQDEYVRCQRYFQLFNPTLSASKYIFLLGTAVNTSQVRFLWKYPIAMRTTPTATVKGTPALQDPLTNATITADSIGTGLDLTGVNSLWTHNPGGLTVGNTYYAFSNTVDGDIWFDAEL